MKDTVNHEIIDTFYMTDEQIDDVKRAVKSKRFLFLILRIVIGAGMMVLLAFITSEIGSHFSENIRFFVILPSIIPGIIALSGMKKIVTGEAFIPEAEDFEEGPTSEDKKTISKPKKNVSPSEKRKEKQVKKTAGDTVAKKE